MAIEKITLQNVRLSFPKLIEASSQQPGSPPKFSADFILPPNHPDFARFMQEVQKMAVETWKEHAQSVLQVCQADRKLRCFGQGAEKIDKKTYKPYGGYDGGVYYISANSNADRPPVMARPDGTLVDASNSMERIELARKLYGGCYVNAVVRPWPQDNQFGRAVRCELVALQFLKDGEAFGEGAVNLTGVFGAVVQAPAPDMTPAPNIIPPFPSFMQ